METEFWRWSATEIADNIRDKRVTSVEVVRSCLERLDEVNPKVNAVVDLLHEDAIRSAKEADLAIARGEELGSLHGVPVTIKINVDFAGRPTTNGVVHFKDRIAKEHSTPVRNWLKAGAVVVGRTNVPAFSTRYFTDNDLHGRTLNPINGSITPGGSSGGAAAAIAAGIGALAHGNDRAGSIRYPAYACGVMGIRPTLGRVPASNPLGGMDRPLSSQICSVQGPLGRSISDLERGLAAMSLAGVEDPWWAPAQLRSSASGEEGGVVGIPRFDNAAPEVSAALELATEWLEEEGWHVKEVRLPHLSEAANLFFSLLMTEELASGQKLIDEHGDEAVKKARGATLTYAQTLDLEEYIEAFVRRAAILREWTKLLDRVQVILMPVSYMPPLPVDFDQRGEAAVHLMLAAHEPLVAVSILGLPSLAIPTGITNGIPDGIQLVANRYREDLCFRAGRAIERRTPKLVPVTRDDGSQRNGVVSEATC